VDMPLMASLYGKSEEELAEELKGEIFHNPITRSWEQSEIYLSGDVRQKLAEAEEAAKLDARYEENVEALEKVIPEDLPPEQINARLGGAWIQPDIVRDFVAETLGCRYDAVTVDFHPSAGQWIVDIRGFDERSERARRWGTEDVNFKQMVEHALASRLPSVTRRDSDGRSYVDAKATTEARAKLKEVKDQFAQWAWSDEDRSKTMVRAYNDTFNNIVERKFDGSHLTFPGQANIYKGKPLELRPHQKNAVWRIGQDLDHAHGWDGTSAAGSGEKAHVRCPEQPPESVYQRV
jgi:N12 class adenine-specific DNA methylase